MPNSLMAHIVAGFMFLSACGGTGEPPEAELVEQSLASLLLCKEGCISLCSTKRQQKCTVERVFKWCADKNRSTRIGATCFCIGSYRGIRLCPPGFS